MKIAFAASGGVSIRDFKLSSADIESQAVEDLSRYREVFKDRHGAIPSADLDVESMAEALWGLRVDYESIPQTPEYETLGYLVPNERIVVDPQLCGHRRRISFTVAHEAGHQSLHSFMYSRFKKSGAVPLVPNSIEWQADTYAASLLAPREQLLDYLREERLMSGNVIQRPIDIETIAPALQLRFGLSRQAMEIRLRRLKVPLTNARYQSVEIK